jgi:hypothetical protein
MRLQARDVVDTGQGLCCRGSERGWGIEKELLRMNDLQSHILIRDNDLPVVE